MKQVKELFVGNYKRPVGIGVGLCFLAAFSGSNTIIYYASYVFAELGMEVGAHALCFCPVDSNP